MLEEAYEAVEAIRENNPEHLKEELGDVLLQVVLHSQIAKEENEFDIDDVAKELNEKLKSLKVELFNLRFSHATGGLKNPIALNTTKKDIAKVKTILRERELSEQGK